MDYNIKLSNGQVLKGLIKGPGEKLRAVVILVHGHGEHIQRYNHWAELFIGKTLHLQELIFLVMAGQRGKEVTLRITHLLMK